MANLATAEILTILQTGDLELEGRLPWSSNFTFLTQVCGVIAEGRTEILRAVYKPRRGERPLWDFAPGTLCLREQAAFWVSEALSWHIVPPTVLRNAAHGLGSLQLFITHDPERHYFTFEGEMAYWQQLQKIVLFDILVNNADRKSGHVLLENNNVANTPGRLWGIDHGICFHVENKLRTVIWEFVGQPISPEDMRQIAHLRTLLETKDSELRIKLQELLSAEELSALQRRTHALIKQGKFPAPGPGRHYPWPPV